jgi:hypothetical protein
MTRGPEAAGWRIAHIGFEDDGLKIDGLEVWKLKWRSADVQPVQLPHPAHPQQLHSFDIHEIGDPAHPARCAACELSNGVWGFYVPVDQAAETSGLSADGSLRYEHRIRPGNGPNDRISSSAVLVDARDGQVVVDCAGWASSRITANADGTLSLQLRQNDFDVLLRINPATRLFCNVVEPGPDQPLSSLADTVEQARLAVIRNSVNPVIRRISPDGRILVDLVSVEWSNSHWVNSPRVTDVASGRVVLDLWNTDWDATVSFPASNQVRLDFRRYRHAGFLTAELDLARKTYRVFVCEVIDGLIVPARASTETSGQDEPAEAPLSGIVGGLEAASRRAGKLAAPATGGRGSSRLNPPPHPLAAWRTALLILVGALALIAVATYWTLHVAPASPQKLDVVPAMPK